jgi:hypothetical protein
MQAVRTLEYRGVHGYPLDDHGRVDRLNCLDRHLPLGEVEEASRNRRRDRKQIGLRAAFLGVHQREREPGYRARSRIPACQVDTKFHENRTVVTPRLLEDLADSSRIECRVKHPFSDSAVGVRHGGAVAMRRKAKGRHPSGCRPLLTVEGAAGAGFPMRRFTPCVGRRFHHMT